MPKLSVGESLSCIFFGYQKSLEKSGGEYQDFPSKFFFISVPKNSIGESFTVALNSDCEKVRRKGGGEGYEDFTSKNFCLTVPKSSGGESLTVALISGTEKIWIRGGKITIFCRKFFFSQCRKFSWGVPLVLH